MESSYLAGRRSAPITKSARRLQACPTGWKDGGSVIMKVALIAAAAYFFDRRCGCSGADDHDSTTAVLCREDGGESYTGRVADRGVCGLSTGVGAPAGADVGFYGTQAAADC